MDQNHESMKLVFTGSPVDAYYIKGLLEENGIESLLRDPLNQSAGAGWDAVASEDYCELYVLEENEVSAAKVVAGFLEDEK